MLYFLWTCSFDVRFSYCVPSVEILSLLVLYLIGKECSDPHDFGYESSLGTLALTTYIVCNDWNRDERDKRSDGCLNQVEGRGLPASGTAS